MWTISSFRANQALYSIVASVFIFACFSGAISCTPYYGPETPKTRPVKTIEKPKTINRVQLTRPVVLRSVEVRKLDPSDPKVRNLANQAWLKSASNPLVIEVQLVKPIDLTPRSSMPAIVLNGTPILDTRIHPDTSDKLIAILPNRRLIKDRNTITAVWLGNERETLSKEALIFKEIDIID